MQPVQAEHGPEHPTQWTEDTLPAAPAALLLTGAVAACWLVGRSNQG